MSSRERRLLDKDIEIRKLQGELKHYKNCFFSCVFELERTRKALEIAKERLKNTILDVEILATPEYLASRAKETLAEITALEQKE